ncbi:MAG: rRNA maturation RNase YbeY [Dehalococcoidia bacterium]
MNRNLDISIDEPFDAQVRQDWLRSAVDAVFELETVDDPVELSLVITGDANVRELNRVYRGLDSTTDVLAFALQEGDEFPPAIGGPVQLGEVIISFDQAERQASEQGHSLKRELEILTIHGVLHLLGYDHHQLEEERTMQAREGAALDRIENV